MNISVVTNHSHYLNNFLLIIVASFLQLQGKDQLEQASEIDPVWSWMSLVSNQQVHLDQYKNQSVHDQTYHDCRMSPY